MMTKQLKNVDKSCRCDNPDCENANKRGPVQLVGMTNSEVGQLIMRGRVLIRHDFNPSLDTLFVLGVDDDGVVAAMLEVETSTK